MPKYESLELGADSQLKYFAGYTTQGGAALALAELNGSSVALPITSIPLAASANFTGTTQDRLNVTAGATAVSGGIPLAQQAGVLVSKVKGSVYSDQAGTLYIEESNDNSTWTQTTTLAVSAGIFIDTGWVYLSKRYYRLRYANGATAQNTFSLFQSVGAGQSDVQLMGSSISLVEGNYDTTLNIANLSTQNVDITPPSGYIWRLKAIRMDIPVQTGATAYQISLRSKNDPNVNYASVVNSAGTTALSINTFQSSTGTQSPSSQFGTSLLAISATNQSPFEMSIYNSTGALMSGSLLFRIVWEQEGIV